MGQTAGFAAGSWIVRQAASNADNQKTTKELDLSLSSDSSKEHELAGRDGSKHRRRDPRKNNYQRGPVPMAGVELQLERSQPSAGYPYSENGCSEKKKTR